MDRRVVFPAPFGPITATSSPRPAARETPRSATLSPYRLTRSRAAIVVAVAVSTARRLAESRAVKLLFVGDVVGGIGRRTLAEVLPVLHERHRPDFVVVNGENAAGGLGITRKTAREIFDAGVDAITLGNHAYRHREVYDYLDQEPRIVRPSNFPKGSPGRGHTVVEANGMRLGVVNLSGLVFLEAVRSPFAEVDAALADLRGKADAVLVDMHAEATSEKVAMGWHVDGRALACVGTHTHIPTADGRVLPGGTAYITDVGMTGPRGGVIGVKREQALERFLTLTQVRFETSDEDPWLNAVLIEGDAGGRAVALEQILVPGGAERA
jgi:metallophosphoesterase (TIGR00282 family)